MRSRFLILPAATLVLLASSAPAHRSAPGGTSAYPSKPVRVVVGLAPGGATDAQARVFSQRLTELMGQQFIVDNRAGAGGLIGFQTVANATPDGYTLLATSPSLTLIPYKGVGPALSDLLGGQIHATFANPTNVSAHLKSGRLRALAVSSSERSRVFPDLPTIAESGIAGYDVTSWQGWLAPAGTSASIVNKLHAALAKFANVPAIADKLTADGGEPVGNTPEQFRHLIGMEAKRWRTLVKNTGIRMEP